MFQTMEELLTHHDRVIVIDVDDVIAKHVERDYENAIPNLPVIEKMRELKAKGFYFLLFTGRGMLSLKGDKDKIDQERRPVLEDWLFRNAVPCDYLLMGKPLGLFYVDDKALRPSEFLELEVVNLGGYSPARVERIGDKVVKYGYGVERQEKWYRLFSEFKDTYPTINLDIPAIYSYMDHTLWMSFVIGFEGRLAFSRLFDDLLENIRLFNTFKKGEGPGFVSYIHHITANHAEGLRQFNGILPFDKLLFDNLTLFDNYRSFSHGDLTLSNIIFSEKTTLIDPNYNPDLYSSYILDFSKLLQSVYLGYEEIILGVEIPYSYECFNAIEKNLSEEELRLSFIALLTHLVRMRKYHPPYVEWIDLQANNVYEDLKNL